MTYWPKIANFAHPLSFSAVVQGDPLRIYGKALRLLKLESKCLPGSRWWKFGDPSLHRFWLIHPCDGQTDGQTELRWFATSVAAVTRKKTDWLIDWHARWFQQLLWRSVAATVASTMARNATLNVSTTYTPVLYAQVSTRSAVWYASVTRHNTLQTMLKKKLISWPWSTTCSA